MSAKGTANYHYLRFAISPSCNDALTIRKLLQDALLQSFGLTSANIQLDLLWIADNGTETILRARQTDATKLMAAAASSTVGPNLALIKDSPFLPSVLVGSDAF
ncbi:hypothetical protein BDY19DRAFT_884416 [Irpex rosettiformis]|uniref:Uncharacterized protein n=1 Tax=Irpex rosettiformis TaxID=378272 RepID=A0ACB8UDV3_9APHY|nr:hypothetical protein BDY19DRAFT_884416 [Irpex rosettiformis]